MTEVQTNGATSADTDHRTLVSVTLVVTDPETGETQTLELTIPSGPTKVPELKGELGVPAAASLWLVRPGGKPIQLVDHATHDVKTGDRYETVVKGGVS
jgi:hypothetical protein